MNKYRAKSLNKTQTDFRIGFYNSKNRMQDIVKDVQKAHFVIGSNDPSKSVSSSQVLNDTTSNKASFQNPV